MSPVPDLLYEDQCAQRIEDIKHLLERPQMVQVDTALHRVTVFVTYRCNLACPYCKTIVRNKSELEQLPQRAHHFKLQTFRTLLDSLEHTQIRHLHLTGGEATIHPELPQMVALAKARGIAHVSLTSNGARPYAVYAALLKAGLDELRLSIDAADEASGRLLTLRDGAWTASINNLRALHRHPGNFFLIANVVVTPQNRAQLARIVRTLIEAGADDVKLITEVDAKLELGNFDQRETIIQALRRLLAAYPQERFPLLRRKLGTVFSKAAVGLENTKPLKGLKFRCFIPLTERTVDSTYYYPCSVYLREGGAPIGRVDEPQKTQREKTAAFVARDDCLEDTICKRYCLHCTKVYNERANEARRHLRLATGEQF